MALVFLGLPKGGTTTFHTFMSALGVPSLHVGGSGYVSHGKSLAFAYQQDRAACAASGSTGSLAVPAYERAVEALGDVDVLCAIRVSGYAAFADDPWPVLWPFLEVAAPDTRFVLWERDPKELAASAVRFFKEDREWPWLRLAYGACNYTDRYQAHIERVTRAHYAAIRDRFLSASAPSARRSRLLIVRYGDADAGRRICDFAASARSAVEPPLSCQTVTNAPKAMPEVVFSDGEHAKMPLGRPQDIDAVRACVANGSNLSAAQRASHLRAAHNVATRVAIVARMFA